MVPHISCNNQFIDLLKQRKREHLHCPVIEQENLAFYKSQHTL